jgi:hypothetical protein
LVIRQSLSAHDTLVRSIAALFLALAASVAAPSHARPADGAIAGEGVEVEGAGRLVAAAPVARPPALAEYGPVLVLDERRAAVVDATDGASPALFAAMLRDHPRLAVLEMIECPGTDDDRANLAVGRMIRAAQIETHVPRGGSVRSGAVELFLAGAARRIDDGAEFAVHSWVDEYGREADDVAADAPENRAYLDYYVEMGMERGQARAFYDMTNSVPNGAAKWLTAQDMRGWLVDGRKGDVVAASPSIAYLDLGTRFP